MRTALLISLFAVATLAFVGCSIVGGGIAGAGYDAVWDRNAAKNYKSFKAPSLQIVREEVEPPLVRQAFDKMFDDFPEHTLIDQDSAGRLGDFTIIFRRHRFTVQRSGTTIIDERLPSVFYMHDLQVARVSAQPDDLLLFLTRSRATTGLSFVGLYTVSGQRLWTTTLPSVETRDCVPSPKGVTFIGRFHQRLHVSLL